MKIENYSARQISFWGKSTITTYDSNGYVSGYGYMTSETLLSLFHEGFVITGKTAEGYLTVKNIAGVEIEIHSSSLARALRKAARGHAIDRHRFLSENRQNMAMLIGCKNGFQEMAVFDADIAIDTDLDSPAETYILIITKKIRHRFYCRAWNAPIEYIGKEQ